MGDGRANLASHVNTKVDTSASVRYGSRHECIRGLWLLLRIAADGVGIEKDIKDESVWFCFPCIGDNTVSELGRTIQNRDILGGGHAVRCRSTKSLGLRGNEGRDSRDYLGLLRERESVLWEYTQGAHADGRRESESSEIGGASGLEGGPVKQDHAESVAHTG